MLINALKWVFIVVVVLCAVLLLLEGLGGTCSTGPQCDRW